MTVERRPPRAGYFGARSLYLRGMGLVFSIAFVSAGVQLEGLYGSEGVLPVEPWLRAISDRLGDDAMRTYPTVFWFAAGDRALVVAPVAGALAAAAMFVGFAPRLSAALCWLLYLSIVVIGRVFFSFQWDTLLLEAGFLALLFSPSGVWLHRAHARPPSRIVRWLLYWLLLRFMVSAGAVKLLSNDPAWWGLTALDFHYFTTCLPTWTAWYAHQLPAWFQKLSVAVMFAIEVVVPFFILGPRPARRLAFVALVLLQVLIAATGNYNFFNLLTVVLCVTLLDDELLAKLGVASARTVPTVMAATARAPRDSVLRGCRTVALAIVAALIVVSGSAQQWARFYGWNAVPWQAAYVAERLQPYRLTSSYGLFAGMTKSRPEIVIEGSDDGRDWKAYEFRYKPGAPERRPEFVAPHQPRLDWQMWFAALGDYRRNVWLLDLERRLLENAAPVLALLEYNPFPEDPPRYIRALRYDYRFTTAEERAQTGDWWVRTLIGQYSPTLARRD